MARRDASPGCRARRCGWPPAAPARARRLRRAAPARCPAARSIAQRPAPARARCAPRRVQRGKTTARRSATPRSTCSERAHQPPAARSGTRQRDAAQPRQQRLERDLAGDDACSAPARQFVARERRVLALAAQRFGVHRPARLRIEHADVGDAAFDQRPALACSVPSDAPSTRAGSLVSTASARARPAPLPAPHFSARPSSSSRPVAPGSASANGSVFASSSTGVWSNQRVDGAVGQPGAQRVAVALLAQRRRQRMRLSK